MKAEKIHMDGVSVSIDTPEQRSRCFSCKLPECGNCHHNDKQRKLAYNSQRRRKEKKT